MSNSADVKLALESDSSEENSGVYIRKGGSISKQVVQLVVDTLQTASDMMLVRENKHVLSYERTCCPHLLLPLILFFSRNTSCSIKPGNTESTPVLSPYTPHTKTKPPQSSAVAQPPSTCLPPWSSTCLDVTVERLRADGIDHRVSSACWPSSRTALTPGPTILEGWVWRDVMDTFIKRLRHCSHFSSADFQLSGPVIDLSLHECSTKMKISVRSLVQPINVEMQQPARIVRRCLPCVFFFCCSARVDSICNKPLQ